MHTVTSFLENETSGPLELGVNSLLSEMNNNDSNNYGVSTYLHQMQMTLQL